MRVPDHVVAARPHLLRRYQVAVLVALAAVILLALALQAVADTYANYLWYRSIGETMVWRSMAETKLGLAVVFSGLFFAACWASLWAVDNFSAFDIYAADDDVVRRYRASLGRYRVGVRTVISLALGLAVGVGASSQWQHWLLYLNGRSFSGPRDPLFGRNVSFYVFRLPFLSFLVDWSLVALLVLFVVTALAHYLNGGLRFSGPSPRVDGHVVSHLSLVLALMALVRGAAYFFVDRYALDLSTSGFVAGAGYTDVTVRLPAISILAITSMLAFALLSFNIYHRTIALPVVAVGMWAFLALILGVVFPAAVQWLKVSPSESTVELPYIRHDIQFTREAFDLRQITAHSFAGIPDLTGSVIEANRQSLADVPVWDAGVAAPTYSALQALQGYYRIEGLSEDRYELGVGRSRSLVPVVVGTRAVDESGLPHKTWVSEHLEYTHGYGVVISPANESGPSGQPLFSVRGIPVASYPGAPIVTQPEVYFGDSPSTYVVADTREPEVNGSGTNHYHGGGGVRLDGFWQRAAFAVKFHDVNLLLSDRITSRSRLIYRQDVVQRIEEAAPFLHVDSHPYPVVAAGRIFWMVPCYTTTDDYPYSESSPAGLLPATSGLAGQFNYVRDAVTAVVDAYSGQVHLYALDPSDPILLAWERAFPGLVQPLGRLADLTPSDRGALLAHLRYPQDLLTVMSEMYGRYHYLATRTQAAEFAEGQAEWEVAEGENQRPSTPAYELVRLPGHSSVSFVAVEPLVPASSRGGDQLVGFVTAASSAASPSTLTFYELPRVSESLGGPASVAGTIAHFRSVEAMLTRLDGPHSFVADGPVLVVPIENSILYVESFYAGSGRRGPSSLESVTVAYGGDHVALASSLLGALRQLFGRAVQLTRPPPLSLPARIARDLALAYRAYERTLSAGDHFRLGELQKDLSEMGKYLSAAHRLMERTAALHRSGSAPRASA